MTDKVKPEGSRSWSAWRTENGYLGFLPFFFSLEARGNGRVQDLDWVTGVARNWRALSRGNQRTESTLVCMITDKLFMKVAGLEGEGRLGKLGPGLKCSESMQVWEAVDYNDEGLGKRRLGDTNLKSFYFLCLFLNLGVPEYALESALETKEGSVLKRLWDDEQELQNGALRAEQDFGWGKEVEEDSGRKLKEFFFFFNHRGKKERQCAKSDVPRIMVVPGSFWQWEWDPCLGHSYGSLPSRESWFPWRKSRLLHEHLLRRKKWPPVCGVGSLCSRMKPHLYRFVEEEGHWILQNCKIPSFIGNIISYKID